MGSRPATLAAVVAALMSVGPFVARGADGVIEINQALALAGSVTAGDTSGLPVTLSVGGNYVLTSDLVVPDANTRAIEITAAYVTIDLNGFALVGPVSCPGAVPVCSPIGTGAGVFSNQNSVSVRGGTIRGMGSYGISIASGARIEEMNILHNAGGGVSVQGASLVRGSSVTNNGAAGVSVGLGSRVTDNVIFRNAGIGIIFSSSVSGYGGNVIRENNGGDANLQMSSVNAVQLSPNVCGADLICP